MNRVGAGSAEMQDALDGARLPRPECGYHVTMVLLDFEAVSVRRVGPDSLARRLTRLLSTQRSECSATQPSCEVIERRALP